MVKKRVDVLLVEKGLVSSRERAKALVLAGQVLVAGQPVKKAGEMYEETAELSLKQPDIPYVSRGGLKLEKALQVFSVSLANRVCIDVGASTGGFSECMLQAGAKSVYAVDVGYGQLAWKLRTDPRVIVMERTNARYLEPDMFAEAPTFASIDVSFISIGLILPALKRIGVQEIAALIKPQFEAGREQVGKKGIVREKAVHEEVLYNVKEKAEAAGYYLSALTFSPIRGQEGNIEFLGHFFATPQANEIDISKIVLEAHESTEKK